MKSSSCPLARQYRFRLRTTFFLLLLCCLQALAIPVEVEQTETLKVSSQGETLFEVAPIGTEELAKLKQMLQNPPAKVVVSAQGGVLKGLSQDLTVTADIAKRWNSEAKALASLFAERLNAALGDFSPKWNVSGQTIPLSESREVRLSPFRASDSITVSSSDPSVVELQDLGNGRYKLTGKSNGRANLLISSSRESSLPELPVSVKPWAARWDKGPGRLSFWGEVTPQRVDRTLRRWLSARALLGANVSVEKVGTAYKAQASAPGAISVEETFSLEVQTNPPQAVKPASQIVLSNHPERIVSDGVLFDRSVKETPFRFMWHHRNDPQGNERHLVLQLTNPTNVTRRLRMFWYSYGPSPDEIHVGHTAALDYSAAGIRGLGEEIVLPANGRRTVEIRRVKPGQTMSGMAYLSDIGSSVGPLEVKVLATSGGGELPDFEAEVKDKGRTASGIFAGDIRLDASHLLGGPFTYLEFGGEPYEKDVEKGHPSYGNFGTVYRTRLLLKNPSDTAQSAIVGFASGGGAARGVLALDGELFDLPMGVTGNGLTVKTYTLQPGEIRQVDIELFPQAGSNYPVRVVIRSDFERRAKEDVAPLRPLQVSIP